MKSLTIAILVSVFCAVAVAYGDDPRNEVAIVDNPAEDYLIICGREFDREGGGYSTCKLDLNGDERNDQMFANAATSGTGGEAATIYLAREDGRFTRIGTILHQGLATETIKTGGRLLHCSSNGGGGHSLPGTSFDFGGTRFSTPGQAASLNCPRATDSRLTSGSCFRQASPRLAFYRLVMDIRDDIM